MELNIAFSTIFYVAVFIVPGLIFRRIYFQGEHNKQFSQGNLVERVVWTIFTSVVLIILVNLIIYVLKYDLKFKILDAFNYDNVVTVFGNVGDNKLPEKKLFDQIYFDFTSTVILLYITSFLLAHISYVTVIRFGLDRKYNFLKFNNYWYYFLRGKAPHLKKNEVKKYLWTDADVMVDNGNDGIKMYSGAVVDYYIDKTTNQLDMLFLKDTKRYKFLKDEEESEKKTAESPYRRKYDLKDIPGNTFCIPFSKIHNMNLRYVSKTNPKRKYDFAQLIKMSLGVLFIITLLALIGSLFVSEWPYIGKINLFYRLLFAFNTLLIISIFISFVMSFIENESKNRWTFLFITIFFLVQYLWIFQIYSWVYILPTSFLFVYLIASIGSRKGS